MLIYPQQNFTALSQLVLKHRQKHTVAVYLRLIIAMHFPVVNKKAADADLKRKAILRLIVIPTLCKRIIADSGVFLELPVSFVVIEK